MLAKRKERPVDMAGELLRFRGLVDSFIDGKVEQIKQSRDGESLPREYIKQMITRGSACPCRTVAELLDKDGS
jgi:hypothetical protein